MNDGDGAATSPAISPSSPDADSFNARTPSPPATETGPNSDRFRANVDLADQGFGNLNLAASIGVGTRSYRRRPSTGARRG